MDQTPAYAGMPGTKHAVDIVFRANQRIVRFGAPGRTTYVNAADVLSVRDIPARQTPEGAIRGGVRIDLRDAEPVELFEEDIPEVPDGGGSVDAVSHVLFGEFTMHLHDHE